MLNATNNFVKRNLNNKKVNCNYGLIIVQHLLPDTECFLDILKKAGFNIIKVYGIEYSTKNIVLEQIKNKDISVISPRHRNLKKIIRQDLINDLEIGTSNLKGIFIHEVGGYFADIFSKPFNIKNSFYNKIEGVIEETKQGHWRYNSLKSLKLPVLSIADSVLKDVEGKYVGESVAKVVFSDLRDLGLKPKSLKIGVTGFGIIGGSVAKSLLNQSCDVAIFDKSSIKIINATLDGFKIKNKNKLIKESDLIIGSSGSRVISYNELKDLKDNVILASASSRSIEYPINKIKRTGSMTVLSDYVKEYKMPWNKCIRIINEGFPINFRFSSLPIHISDLMFCQISYCIYKLMNGKFKSGLYRLSEQEEQIIANLWLDSHAKSS